ncbi:DUF190 domain-containing protein [uncultured Clostridium sp.]|uniref:DUF190 domain-containing protein n=1 Tax=uncultured Clostridium sp. TaxID=59620 RepID=UPI0026053C36|nr:DUF190 domain-containing protein [uncultured Clostridium sp.]
MESVNGKLVKIFIEGSDKFKHEPLYKAIIEKLEELNISGATVLRGIEGFGTSKELHLDIFEVAARKLPIVIETLVLSQEKLNELIEGVSPMIKTGKIAITDNVTVLSFK